MRNAKIIVVDDNEAVLRSLRTILSHEFKTIVTVSSPVLLPALLRNGDVDMVLLDMNFGDRKSTRLNSSHPNPSRMPSSA